MGLFLYLPMSTFPGLEELSENPTPITLVLGACAAVCVGVMLLSERRAAFDAELKRVLLAGTIAGIAGRTAYGAYGSAFAPTLASAEAAPQLGEAPPDFSVTDPEGRTHSLSENLGAPVLLVFFRGQW